METHGHHGFLVIDYIKYIYCALDVVNVVTDHQWPSPPLVALRGSDWVISGQHPKTSYTFGSKVQLII